MRFVVTGATGFVGDAVARRLLEDGHEVHALVRGATSADALRQAGARVFEGTIADPNDVVEAAHECDVVVHAAAIASHRAARRALEWTNIAGTENVVNAARHAGCKRMVHVSCGDVTLSNQDRVNWNEDRFLQGSAIDPHAQSKALAEELVLAACADGLLETTAVRPAILWGPGDTTTLPQLCRARRFRLVGRGENLVSSTYIDHLVDAIALAARAEEAPGRAYHVTDGTFVEARELFGALCEAAGLPPPALGPSYGLAYALSWGRRLVGSSGPWPTDVIRRGRSTVLDHQRAVNELGYEPHVSLAEGMAAVGKWARRMGGADAIAAMARAPADASEVDTQVAAAGGD